uniref:Uncharacterized protein n=1 Tax=Setaria viridis TaxID=4556 RepID=A0A4U6VX20_SETVI|nr:hypothetical protein SEVIR_2G313500v2 [Setaria viridis]
MGGRERRREGPGAAGLAQEAGNDGVRSGCGGSGRREQRRRRGRPQAAAAAREPGSGCGGVGVRERLRRRGRPGVAAVAARAAGRGGAGRTAAAEAARGPSCLALARSQPCLTGWPGTEKAQRARAWAAGEARGLARHGTTKSS